MKNGNVDTTAQDEKVKKNKNIICVMVQKFFKRFVDIIAGIIGTLMLIPLTLIIYIINKIFKEDGPIFYCQERIGLNGKKFHLYKFRTMCTNSQEILDKILREDAEKRKEWEENRKFKDDPRITKIGKFLRKTSLDEFPQFICVLKGEMSLVRA